MADIFDEITAMLPAHTPGAVVAPEFKTAPDPTRNREVMGVSRPGSKVFKTPQESEQAARELTDTAKVMGSVVASPAVSAVAGLAGLLHEGDTTLDQKAAMNMSRNSAPWNPHCLPAKKNLRTETAKGMV